MVKPAKQLFYNLAIYLIDCKDIQNLLAQYKRYGLMPSASFLKNSRKYDSDLSCRWALFTA